MSFPFIFINTLVVVTKSRHLNGCELSLTALPLTSLSDTFDCFNVGV